MPSSWMYVRPLTLWDIWYYYPNFSPIGFAGEALSWFKGYVDNRQHCVRLEDHISSKLHVPLKSGVPQGSILGSDLISAIC